MTACLILSVQSTVHKNVGTKTFSKEKQMTKPEIEPNTEDILVSPPVY